MDNLKEMVKERVPIYALVRYLGIDHNAKFCRCINPVAHNNNDNKFSLLIKAKSHFICFSCGIKGDVIQFYMEYAKADFKTALKFLAETFNVKSTDTYLSHKSKNSIVSKKEILSKKNEKKCSIDEFREGYYDEIHEADEKDESNTGSSDWKEDYHNEIYKNPYEYPLTSQWEQEIYDERSGKYEYSGNMNTKDAKARALLEMRTERLEKNTGIFEDLFLFSMNTFSGIDTDILNYLSDERKIREEVLVSSRIFSLPEIPDTYKYLKSKYTEIELQQAGLINEKNNLVFRSNHRLMIPYLSDNKIIFLRSRYFNKKNKDPKGYKYLNLKNISFGLNSTKRFFNCDILNKINSKEDIYITEGEFDCLSMLSMNLNAIGIPGVSSIPDKFQLERLLRFNTILSFDNDNAGKELAVKLKSNFKNHYGVDVKSLELPPGVNDISDFMVRQLTNNNYKSNTLIQ